MKSIIKIFVFASLLLMSNLAKSGVSGPPVAPVKDCNQYKMQIDDLRKRIAVQKNEAARYAKMSNPYGRQNMLHTNKIIQQLQEDKAAAQNRLMQCTGSNEKYKNAQQLEKKAAADKAAASKAAAEKAAASKAAAEKAAAEKAAASKEAASKAAAEKAAAEKAAANKAASDKENKALIDKEPASPFNPNGVKPANKAEFAKHLQEILKYTAVVDATLTALEKREMTAQQWNARLMGLSSAQLACGLAATALGITLIAITAGVAAPAVAAASVAIGAAGLGTGVGGAAIGAAGGVAKAGRKNALGEKNEKKTQIVSDPDSKKKAAGVEVAKAGVVKGGIEGTKASVAVAGASIGAQAVVGSSIGAAGGVVTTGMAAKNINDAKNFKEKDEAAKLYREQGHDWDIIHTNLQNLRIALSNTKYTSINPSFCKQVRDKVRITEDKVFRISQRLKMKAEAEKAAAKKAGK